MSELLEARDAFDRIFSTNYRRYGAAVLRFIRRIVYDRDISEELCQDVFLKVYERRIELDPESPRTLNFFFTAARNAAIDHLRRRRAEEDKLRDLRIRDAVMDRQFYEDIENACLRGEVISTLSDVINAFPEEDRALVAARCLGGRSAASLARDSGISAYRVRKIEEEAHRRIRTRMEGFFGEEDGKTGLTEKNTPEYFDRSPVRIYSRTGDASPAPARRKRAVRVPASLKRRKIKRVKKARINENSSKRHRSRGRGSSGRA